MGAGKTTIGRRVAALLERPFVDLDEELERRHGPITRIFEEQGESEFRRLELEALAEALGRPERAVLALGGGALATDRARELLGRDAFTVLLDVDVDTAWERARGGDRPLAQDEDAFRRLFEERRTVYDAAADARAEDVEGVLLATLAVRVEPGLVERGSLARQLPGGSLALVADERVLALHELELGNDLRSTHAVPAGEAAKDLAVLEQLWDDLDLDRSGAIVAFGGGSTTDVAGFAAATYLRGIAWFAVPTTLVGQVDAAIGGKTGINLRHGKNLAGAFHLPRAVFADPAVLATLPSEQRREGTAEVVKTGLLAGRELWTLPDEPMVRGCAAFKCAVVVSDPEEKGRRAVLNLGHTFAHALETGAGHGAVSHGSAVALGLTAAIRLSERRYDLDPSLREEVERVLEPAPVTADVEAAWAAMRRDKKAEGGRIRLVLLEAFGKAVHGVELPDDEIRAELERLIAG
jgi:shikimate kinase/3-dehydroquinate synthase